ncbi:unnamed protein product, partial [Callosobruchus maculatus]
MYSGTTKKQRLGRILLFTTDPKSGLSLLQTINTPAVLDQKWCPIQPDGHPVLAVVNANKSIEIYRLKEELQLEQVTSFTFDDDPSETLILSLDWSKTGDPEIVCSDSKGRVHLLNLNNNQLQIQHSHHAHEYEAWISAFCYHDLNIYFSGGDDCMFFKYDKRVSQGPVSKNRSHEAGVTSLHSHSSKEYLISTGSYDEYIRLWDHRTMKHEMSSIKMPETLWRLKWDPFEKSRLLAACMLGGVHVVDATNIQKLKIIASHYDHKNLAYGADWCHLDAKKCGEYPEEGNILIASCSFYDHLLCVSKFYS